jgi:hypothetical protein
LTPPDWRLPVDDDVAVPVVVAPVESVVLSGDSVVAQP